LKGRVIFEGKATGELLLSNEPMGWLGCVDPVDGMVIERGHPLEGRCVKDKILVFSSGKGSTVGSYTIYALKKNNVAPAAIICEQSEPVVAVGAIISKIPMVDLIPLTFFKNANTVSVDGEDVFLK